MHIGQRCAVHWNIMDLKSFNSQVKCNLITVIPPLACVAKRNKIKLFLNHWSLNRFDLCSLFVRTIDFGLFWKRIRNANIVTAWLAWQSEFARVCFFLLLSFVSGCYTIATNNIHPFIHSVVWQNIWNAGATDTSTFWTFLKCCPLLATNIYNNSYFFFLSFFLLSKFVWVLWWSSLFFFFLPRIVCLFTFSVDAI